MKFKAILLLTLPVIAMPFFGSPANAADLTVEFDAKHKACLERIAEDSEQAYEEAMIWRDEGGGRRAKHCEAMALYALGHEIEAAHRLDKLAKAVDGGDKEMRANFYAEAANFWLVANEPAKAYRSATAGLKIIESHIDLRISRARAYAALGRYDYAETDLSNVLRFDRNHAAALRYRADARYNQGNLTDAKVDIENSLANDPTQVETALLRGHINEAIRTGISPVAKEVEQVGTKKPESE